MAFHSKIFIEFHFHWISLFFLRILIISCFLFFIFIAFLCTTGMIYIPTGLTHSMWVSINPSYYWDSLVAQMVKHLPTMWETWVWSLGWEDPLEKEMATHSSILAWKVPWTPQSMGLQRHKWVTSLLNYY